MYWSGSFICNTTDVDCGTIKTFVNVLVKVFDSLYARAIFHIHVWLIAKHQHWIVRNNPWVIHSIVSCCLRLKTSIRNTSPSICCCACCANNNTEPNTLTLLNIALHKRLAQNQKKTKLLRTAEQTKQSNSPSQRTKSAKPFKGNPNRPSTREEDVFLFTNTDLSKL